MNAHLKKTLVVAAVAVATQAMAQVTFFEQDGFRGRSFTADGQVDNFERIGFNDRASSVVVTRERWEVCENAQFRGRCVVLQPGQYPSLAAMGLNDRVSSVRAAGNTAPVTPQATFYENEGFTGRTFVTSDLVDNFARNQFDNRTSSVVVVGSPWELCENVQFSGRCVVLPPGQYSSMAATGLNDRVSSARVAGNTAPAPAAPQITFYENEGFTGRTFATDNQVRNFARNQFNDRASSVVVVGGPWELCENNQFRGRCVVLQPGQYPSMRAMGLNDRVSSVRAAGNNEPAPAAPQVTFYENEGFTGRTFVTNNLVDDFRSNQFNDRTSSMVVVGSPWQLCEDIQFGGRCVVLQPGQYPSMAAMGLNDRVSSARVADRNMVSNAPAYVAAPDHRRNNNERLYEANVTSVRAVVGTPEQRCWVEPGQVAQTQGNINIPGALVGAVLGGVLGHQVGGGTGKDLATAAGAIAGGALGANVGRTPQAATQDVQRCESTPNQAQAQYWDVSYNFRGQEHRTQLAASPGATITVNEQGEPRM
jgi:uncharacterized protein YcfJ